jgi:3-oxoacyl-[acyl-carrier protein] reductase
MAQSAICATSMRKDLTMAAETTTHAATGHRFLEGSVAIVTGASRGIGAATAKLLARHGATVGVNFHHSRRSADALVAEIQAEGGRALPLKADMTDEVAVGAMVETAESTIGPIDILVCSASGITNPARAPFLKLPLSG